MLIHTQRSQQTMTMKQQLNLLAKGERYLNSVHDQTVHKQLYCFFELHISSQERNISRCIGKYGKTIHFSNPGLHQLKVNLTEHTAKTGICKKDMTAVVTALQKHQATSYHKKQAGLLVDSSSMSRIDEMWREQGKSIDAVKEAEIRIAAFVTEHNLSFNIMDHLSNLLPKLFPDSKIASSIKCK